MTTHRRNNPAADAIAWVTNLPLVSEAELALLTGQPARVVETLLAELVRAGWLDWVSPRSPELPDAKRYVLTPGATHLQPAVWPVEHDAPQAARVHWSDALRRITCIELVASLNAASAWLVAGARHHEGLGNMSAHAFPLTRRQDSMWPAEVHAGLSLEQSEDSCPAADLYLAVARAGLPRTHVRAVVAGWYNHWQPEAVPRRPVPTLLICPDEATEVAWIDAIRDAAERRGLRTLPVLAVQAASLNPTAWVDAICKHAATGNPVRLIEHLMPALPSHECTPRTSGRVHPRPAVDPGLRLQVWAKDVGANDGPASRARGRVAQLAALRLSITAEQLRVLLGVGRYPLLTEADLALVLGLKPHFTRRNLSRCLTQGLVEAIVGPSGPASAGVRYVLTELGLRLLAARQRVPFRRFAEDGTFVALGANGRDTRLQTLLRQFEHTIGANSFFVRCLTARTDEDPRLVAWQSSFEATLEFDDGSGRRRIRPDGGGELRAGASTCHFVLEWDRGTERIAALLAKLDRYAAFYRSQLREAGEPPRLLIVCPTPHREALFWNAATAVFTSESSRRYLFTAPAPLLERRGPFADIWRWSGSSRRINLMEK